MQSLENTGIFDDAYDDREVGVEADLNNLETIMNVSPIPTTRIHKDHPKDQIIRDINSATQTRRMIKIYEEHAMVWTLVDLPIGKRAIGTKWVFKNKKGERGIVIRNKARLVAQGYTYEEGIDYDEMDVKSAFLYGTIEENVYVCQPPSFEDPQFPDKMSSIEELTFFLGLQLQQKKDGIFISQDKLWSKDYEEAVNVDVHLYRSMIGSLMYLTTSRPDITFVVCACARFQVTPKVSHLYVVKRIFRYLKRQPKLGLWYPRNLPFDLEAFSDSDYAGASLDRKSTTGEYVAAANCYGQVLWIQNQMLDYGFNFMNTKIYIDNESTIYIVKNPVFHSKTKHIEIRYHFIRDSYEKRLIQVIKIHIDHNVLDLLTNAFDVSRDKFENKTGSCKVNAARQVKHIEYMVLNASPLKY
ncbi:putative reverse transcriptase, RNA-dependent DNA polymerase [Tanacetum coccineum]